MKAKVILKRASDFNESCLAEVADQLELEGRVRNAGVVIIKPNLCAGHAMDWITGVTTNPETIRIIIKYLFSVNPNCVVKIVESDSSYGGLTPAKFKKNRLVEIADEYDNVFLVDLTRDEHYWRHLEGGYYLTDFNFPQTLYSYDLFITVGKIKTHNVTHITGALKNQFGCLPDPAKQVYHPYISQVIADINRVVRPDLCILDGSPAMQGNGPVFGDLIDLGLVMLGNDPVATDVVMAKIMGFEPEGIKYLKLCEQAGIGTMSLADIEIIGDLEAFSQKVAFVSEKKRFFIKLGLRVQRVGYGLAQYGDAIHGYGSFSQLINGLVLHPVRQTGFYQSFRRTRTFGFLKRMMKRTP